MRILAIVAGAALLIFTLIDAFESIIQPRRVTHRFRYSRLFYRNTWLVWRAAASFFTISRRRAAFLSIFGPLSLLALFATWVAALIIGFALIDWGSAAVLRSQGTTAGLSTYLYLSGTTFFTLGYGDVTPARALGRVLAVVESGLGFGSLAVMISYLPVLYQAFSRRETLISLLDARAGSPPSAGQLLARLAHAGSMDSLDPMLANWEQWAAELLESQLSFPVLSYYRSQHDNQSWLAALTTILDSCSILLVGVKGRNSYQAQLTFAMARHAAVDLCLVLRIAPRPPQPDRLPADELQNLWRLSQDAGLELNGQSAMADSLTELRGMYEPFVNALAERLLMALPPFSAAEPVADNWQRSAWMRQPPGIGNLSAATADEHF